MQISNQFALHGGADYSVFLVYRTVHIAPCCLQCWAVYRSWMSYVNDFYYLVRDVG